MPEDKGVKDQLDPDKKGDGKAEDASRKVVPLEALEAERAKRQSMQVELAELRGKVDGLSASQSQPKKEEREYTRAELRQFVDDGKLTEDQADEIRERQSEARLGKKLTQKVETTTRTDRVQAIIDQYKAAKPDIMIPGSDDRAKVEREFQYLVSLGHPQTLETEAAALRAAYGPVETLAKGKPSLETHQDGGSGDGGKSDGDDEKAAGGPRGLTAEQRAHYMRQIDRGFYDGWDDPELKAEMEYAIPAGKKKKGRAA
jgi:hypothetical protein